ncbi:hypothetical protein BHM03_00019114 [Ensete ventricosum]|uniref:Uncharacterized protein n=1 Tax=Ensete ventricosum TaxID=4639 RepID=A0A445MFN8_ENSVE|nr:hypothetical protein BHM03_00019114 [Ensete ventricosum]
MVASSPWRNELGLPVCTVGRGMWGRLVECFGFRLFDGCSCDIKGVSGAPLRIGGSGLLPSGIGQDQIAKRPGRDGGARRSSLRLSGRADRLLDWPGWSMRLSGNRLFRLVEY